MRLVRRDEKLGWTFHLVFPLVQALQHHVTPGPLRHSKNFRLVSDVQDRATLRTFSERPSGGPRLPEAQKSRGCHVSKNQTALVFEIFLKILLGSTKVLLERFDLYLRSKKKKLTCACLT